MGAGNFERGILTLKFFSLFIQSEKLSGQSIVFILLLFYLIIYLFLQSWSLNLGSTP
jgi:hypothetical protein